MIHEALSRNIQIGLLSLVEGSTPYVVQRREYIPTSSPWGDLGGLDKILCVNETGVERRTASGVRVHKSLAKGVALLVQPVTGTACLVRNFGIWLSSAPTQLTFQSHHAEIFQRS